MEHEKEHHDAEGAERINEGCEQGDGGNQVPKHIEEGEDEIPQEQNRHQNCSDQSEQRSVFKSHSRSMSAASVGPQLSTPSL